MSSYFEQNGDNYARYRPDYPPELATFLAKQCRATQLALDVGCGTGQLSARLAAHFDQVMATDVSKDQLRNAVPHSAIHYRQGSAEHLEVTDCSADLIVAAQAAHWFDLPRFYAEVHRVAKPGALLALISYGVPYLESTVNTCFQKFYWQVMPPFWPSERHHVETGYADLLFPFERLETPEIAIRREWNFGQFSGYIGTWSAVKVAMERGQQDQVGQAFRELEKFWGNPDRLKHIVWPVSTLAGRV